MRLQLFKHNVPRSLIAQYPCEDKLNAKLMVLHRDSGEIEHKRFYNILDYLNPGDIVVANDSYMMNNIIHGYRANTEVIVYLLRVVGNESSNEKDSNCEGICWDSIVTQSRKIRVGNKIYFPDLNMNAEVVDNTSISGRILRFETDKTEQEFLELVNEHAEVNLPSFITRPIQKEDKQWVKSVYAKHFGSNTHVTSGLHFNEQLLLKLKLKDVSFETLTYTITNFPENKFDSKTVSAGKRIPEFCEISDDLIDKINNCKSKSHKVCAVGYSAVLGLENFFSPALGKLIKTTDIVTKTLISATDFNVCDMILTNFLENGSTFLISDAAFCRIELLRKAYEEAVKNEYQFYMYGDSLLII